MLPRSPLSRWLLALALVVAAGLVVHLLLSSAPGGAPRGEAEREPAIASDDSNRPGTSTSEAREEDSPGVDAGLLALFPESDPAWAWSRVDLDALREEMPDNAFWTLAVPTDDPRVLAERREIRDQWNVGLGKVMSNTASEEEIRAYYGERERVSSDYVEFTSRLLERYGDVLPEQDRGLVELSRTLHRARLEEIPRRTTEAIDRAAEHAAVREAWLAEEALFSTDAD